MQPYLMEERTGGILLFTINRPGKRNAINYDVMEGLSLAIETAKQNHVKSLVITGAGNEAFCSGGDLSVFHQLKTEQEAYSMLSKMSHILYELSMLPKPTVAIMNGAAVGGGCEIATACDYRIAKKGIKAGFVQGRLAITTGWGGGSLLIEKIAPSNAMKMLMDAILYDAETMKEFGFINHIYEGDPLEALYTYLENVLLLEVDVLKAYKAIFTRKWVNSDLKQRIEEEVRRCAVLWEGEAHHKQVDKFISKK